ncbi:MAG TPA: flagellar hook-basal body complex protein FliE [Pirellulaceae bacterium]|nr:flagellar hook-basal body complex protein FliE [Pirellulaceae bacterium]
MNPAITNSAIGPIAGVQGIYSPTSSTTAERLVRPAGGESFGDVVQGYLQQVNADQLRADTAIADFVSGKTDNIQQVVLAMANADLSFQFLMEIRNKIIESFHELMRMQF